MLASLDNIQPAADVAPYSAMVNASRMDANAAKAAVNTAEADLKQAKAENERATLDYNRNKALYDAQLIAKADYDTKKAAYDTAAAQLNSPRPNWRRPKPTSIRLRDILDKMPPVCGTRTMCSARPSIARLSMAWSPTFPFAKVRRSFPASKIHPAVP